MKKTLLSILMVLSLLLLPACGTQVGQKSASSSNFVYKEPSVKQEISCVQEDLAVFLTDYSNGIINKEEFLSFVEVVCPGLMERKISKKDFFRELSDKGVSQ